MAVDVSPYVDLRVYDASPADLLARALVDLEAKVPGLVLRPGNVETVLLEAFALEVSELVYAINRVPGAVTEALLRLYGLERDQGAVPTALADFSFIDTAGGYTVPAGTRLRVAERVYVTVSPLTVNPGNAIGTTTIVGLDVAEDTNGLAIGTVIDLLDPVYSVASVALSSSPSGGRWPEDAAAFLSRGVQRLRRLATTLVLPDHFTAAALEQADVERATTIDNYDGGAGTPGTVEGHVTVAVTGSGGADLGTTRRAELEALFESEAVAMLDVHVVGPTITDVDVSATVRRLPEANSAEVANAARQAVADYLSPSTWPWAGTVRRNELIALLDGVEGVDYVEDVAVPAADLPLSGAAPLARADVVEIFVTEPAPTV